ncbi:glutamate-rich protein 1 isoform X2 [Antennarius striatus]|uniref:glutamate-rich protein 1 isoform X2 n=1 Tax=Antennarius striatus TaxID=241820 RepID=UPI0035AFB78D
MARRKEVFQSKVLQKLYPAAQTLEEPSSPCIAKNPAKNIQLERKPSQDDITTDARKQQRATNPERRMYTVLPPPADYKANSEKSITPSQLESINTAQDPAEESSHDASEELEQDKEEGEQKRKRRKRKRKSTLPQDAWKNGAGVLNESCTDQMSEGREHISRNKKRKLKKKRHKEKLLSMGLMPRASALEFTYRKDKEEEEQVEEARAAEVSDFLRTTLEIYKSESTLHPYRPCLLSGTMDDLLSSITSKPPSVLQQLHHLKAFVQRRETDKLEKALKELSDTSSMPAASSCRDMSQMLHSPVPASSCMPYLPSLLQ